MDIIEEIISKTNLSKDDISKKIDDKCSELSGLITKEGAAILVARELGIDIKRNFMAMPIKEIKDGMKNISVVGRIFRISNVNTFKKSNGTEGKVANIWIGDNSGFMRIPLWNEQAVAVEESQFKLGDVIQIFNGMTKMSLYGNLEISLGRYGGIKILDDSGEIPNEKDLNEKYLSKSFQRIKIEDLAPGNFELQGTIVKLFEGEFIFKSCPVCGSSVKLIDGKLKCGKHGDVEPKLFLAISCILDDGTGDLRVVFFRDVARELCKLDAQDLMTLESQNRFKILSEKILGKEITVSGKVRKNTMTDNFEMVAGGVKDINPLDESKKLVNSVQFALGG